MRTIREINQTAFRQLKPAIDQNYPYGRFVAIDGGQIVADSADIMDLQRILAARVNDTREVLVVQAGHEYPEYFDILHGT
ncbi:MAG: hypothetical protein JNM56_10820 [Planctomycetia bacterium]|nr:hypothetical protein [Planctomycetia bacterium]